MGKLIYITGGARSGKSGFALALAKKSGKKVTFIATGSASDKEMQERIAIHKSERPKNWETIEEPLEVAHALQRIGSRDVIILDCMTLLISNLMLSGKKERNIISEIKKVIENAIRISDLSLVISNEVGAGIVPENKLAREYRDIAGRVNQLLAHASDEAYYIVSGLPVKLK